MKKFETLYIVDDDDVYQFIAKKTIEQTGLVELIKTFSNGREAIQFLENIFSNQT